MSRRLVLGLTAGALLAGSGFATSASAGGPATPDLGKGKPHTVCVELPNGQNDPDPQGYCVTQWLPV